MNPDVGKYIGVYFAFGIGSASLVVIQTLILWIFCSIEVGYTNSTGCTHPLSINDSETKFIFRHRHLENFTREWPSPFSDPQ